MISLTSFAGRSIAVFGLGGSGKVTAHALSEGGAQVSAWDDNPTARAGAQSEGIEISDLGAADWSRFDALVLSPGVPLTHPKPHWTVEKARAQDCEIIGDIELFCRQRKLLCPDAPFVAITGTNGKSTTTALVSHLLGHLGCDVQMGGNIGQAILSLEPPSSRKVHVIEISSYQIDLAPSLNPTVGVLLNLSPDHLDRHGTMEHYAHVKELLISGSDMKVVGLDDRWTREIAQRLGQDAKTYPFTVGKGAGLVPRLYALGEALFLHKGTGAVSSSSQIVNLEGIESLRGKHNVQNALAALGVIKALHDRQETNSVSRLPPDVDRSKGTIGNGLLWDPPRLQEGLTRFPGLKHRLELVGQASGVSFVNDSKATNVNSAMSALGAWRKGVFWIAGGLAKEGSIEALIPYFDCVEKAYLIGEATHEFAKTLEGRVRYEKSGTLEQALAQAFEDARVYNDVQQSKGHGKDNRQAPVVLLSPACASFDQFNNFEARGEAFKKLVSRLPQVRMRGGVS